MEYFRQNPRATDTLRGPIYEDKVVDFVLELANVEDSVVTAEELVKDEPPASADGIGVQSHAPEELVAEEPPAPQAG